GPAQSVRKGCLSDGIEMSFSGASKSREKTQPGNHSAFPATTVTKGGRYEQAELMESKLSRLCILRGGGDYLPRTDVYHPDKFQRDQRLLSSVRPAGSGL